ncbi:MAG TPA: nickel-dependent hydrogenase large subunit [Kineosporiaceae bacterium]|jgi:hydrogenase large subunit|nr:nickel-dependent hydrogenase large subunit [Kineosporiaceae bacterium]
MSTRVVIDPVTRIEGHLRIELLTEGQKITEAYAETTQFKGIELVMKDRDPRDAWAFVQRICGVCTVVHAIASVRAVEDAVVYPIPKQADLIRNLVLGSQIVQDHVIHFYHLQALDFVNVVNAAKADPSKAAVAASALEPRYPMNSGARFTAVKEQVAKVLASGQLGIFSNGYWSHPDYRLTPELDLMAVSHYLDALTWQRSMIRINTLFGGKNPHPNFLVGGMASPINLDNQITINQVKLDKIQGMIKEAITFVEDVFLPDVVTILGAYADYATIGRSSPNFLALGKAGYNGAGYPKNSGLKPAALLDGNLANVVDFDSGQIEEYVTSGWYSYQGGNDKGLVPWNGETTPKYTGPKPPYTWLADDPRYTFSKAPRYAGRAVQVGPMPRVLMAYVQKDAETLELLTPILRKLGLKPEQLNSTAGRILGRAVEAVLLARQLQTWFDEFTKGIRAGDVTTFNPDRWDPSSWPASSKGVGFAEVARGTLSHWVRIEGGKVANYQAVVPSTWNGGGRALKQRGPYEEALSNGHPLVDAAAPLEALRTIHSFDPCQSCGIHVLDASGHQLSWAKVQ